MSEIFPCSVLCVLLLGDADEAGEFKKERRKHEERGGETEEIHTEI